MQSYCKAYILAIYGKEVILNLSLLKGFSAGYSHIYKT